MNSYRLFPFLGTLLVVSIWACDTDDQQDALPRLDLNSGSFSGTLPDGRVLDKVKLLVSSDLTSISSSLDGSYVSHSLSVLDGESEMKIVVELPYVKYSEDYIEANEMDVTHAAREHYSYAVAKDKLSLGDKTILSSQATDVTNTFRVLVVDQKDFIGYVSEGVDQTASHLKIVEVVEETEMDPSLGEVNTLLVTFDVDVKLYTNDHTIGEPGSLKGLLKMKYLQK